jgi:hypothetical protein
MAYRTGIRILLAKIGIESNRRSLLPRFPLPIEVPSLLTDFHEVEETAFPSRPDGRIVIENTMSARWDYAFSRGKAVFRGPFQLYEKSASDMRFTFWGNQGYLYRYILYALESSHAVFSFHAAGLHDPAKNRLYIVAGGAGSGKTVFLLSAISRGLKLFSTETVHFRLDKRGPTWFKGSLVDNVRMGTLVRDFPRFCPPRVRDLAEAEVWKNKIALDLSSFQSIPDTLVQPEIVIIFPRIEEGRRGFFATPFSDRRKAAKAVFDNISQKIAETVILYDRVAVPGFDGAALARARLEAAEALVKHRSVRTPLTVLSNPAECWGDLTCI